MYECHITYDKVTTSQVETLEAFAKEWGWKTSFIDGDPALGPGVRFFLTAHDDNLMELYVKMKHTASTYYLPTPVREKIEQIVYDTKFGKTELTV